MNLALETLTIGIILGMIVNNNSVIKLTEKYKPGIKYALKKLLKYGIVLLGFKLNFFDVLSLGDRILLLVVGFIPAVLVTALILGKIFQTDECIAMLIGVGSSICGTSAIVALSPTVGANEEESVISVSIVSFLGALGVLLYTFVSNISLISDIQFGVWSGLSLHGVAHALAAAFARGEVSGEIGTFVKMSRVVMLVPVSMFLSYFYSKKRQKDTKAQPKFPRYVLLFILAGLLNSLINLPRVIVNPLTELSSLFIAMAMIAMGLSVHFKSIKSKGKSALILGLLLFIISSTITYIIVPFLI